MQALLCHRVRPNGRNALKWEHGDMKASSGRKINLAVAFHRVQSAGYYLSKEFKERETG
jgi:hypothetical protein